MEGSAHKVRRKRRGKKLPYQCTILMGFAMLAIMYMRTGGETAAAPQHARSLLSFNLNITIDPCAVDFGHGESHYPTSEFFSSVEALPLQILIMLYMFIGLAVVCDEYFESSLAEICEYLSLSDDVAGATFMAAGSSAPELFTSVMGVFVAESDVGIGTIVGSAVFNVLIIIGAVALTAVNPKGGLVRLQWWPLTRDSVFYCLTIVLLVKVVFDGVVDMAESIACLVMYLAYCILMKYNATLEKKVKKIVANSPNRHCPCENEVMTVCDSAPMQLFIMLCIVGNLIVVIMELSEEMPDSQNIIDVTNLVLSSIFIAEMVFKIYGMGFVQYWQDPANAFDGILVMLIIGEFMLTGGESGSNIGGVRSVRMFRVFKVLRGLRCLKLFVGSQGTIVKTGSLNKKSRVAPVSGEDEIDRELAMAKLDAEGDVESPLATKDEPKATDGEETKEEEKGDDKEALDDDDDDDDEPNNPFQCPEGGVGAKLYWIVTFPLCAIMFISVPGPHWGAKYKKYFFGTFIMSIMWIGLLSFIMVWMAELFGTACSIPPPVMGLTILAAGTSIPDTIASVNVGKAGKGDMAVSNSIGSNVFDILIGLGVPWFIKTVIMSTNVIIGSDSLAISVMILFITVAIVVMSIHLSGWYLTKKVGYFLLSMYVLYVIQALLTEFKIILTPGCPN